MLGLSSSGIFSVRALRSAMTEFMNSVTVLALSLTPQVSPRMRRLSSYSAENRLASVTATTGRPVCRSISCTVSSP